MTFQLSLDYIFFMHGFAFFLLATSIALLRTRLVSSLGWLATFSIFYGLSIWTGLLNIAFGRPLEPDAIEMGLFCLSLAALAEFVLRDVKHRRMAHTLAALVLLLPAFAGQWFVWSTIQNTLTIFLLIPLSVGTGVIFNQTRKSANAHRRLPLLLLVISLSLYVANLLIRTLVRAQPPTDTFMQGLATLFVLSFNVSFWWVHCTHRRDYRPFYRLMALVGSLLLMGYIATEGAGRLGEKLQQDRQQESIQLVESTLLRATDDAYRVAAATSLDARIVSSLKSPKETELNQALDHYARLCSFCTLYLVDLNGKVIASSDRKRGAGQPYFPPFANSSKTGYFSAGSDDDGPAFFATVALRDQDQSIPALAVAKIQLQSLNLLDYLSGESFLVDPSGAVLIASDPALENRALWPISERSAEQLIASKRFARLDMRPILPASPESLQKYSKNGQTFSIAQHRTVENWSLIFLFPETLVTYFRLGAICLTFLLCTMLLIAFLGYEHQADARAAIANSERQYRGIFEQNGLVTLIVNPANGSILDANLAACRFYGYDRQELKRKRLWELSVRSESEALRLFEEALAQTNQHLESRHRQANGTIRDVEVYAVKIPFEGEWALYFMIHDISEQKQIEAEKKSMLGQLIQSAKLASIGTLAAGVAHEINNPLTILSGFIGMLREQLSGLPHAERYLVNIEKQERAANRIAAIVNGLRTYARADTDQIAPLNVHKTIDETLALVEAVYKKKSIKISLVLASRNPIIQANAGKLQQILVNLISNATDALEKNTGNKLIEIKTFDDGDRLQLWVSDNGCGIDPSIQGRIGDPFFTTKPPGKGTGLGLSICRALIESFSGTMTVESELGKGTRFKMSFPSVAEVPAGIATDMNRKFRFSGSALIIDDEPEIRELLREYLMSFGMTPLEAADGRIALDLLRQRDYALALIDLQMPNMAGDELLKELNRMDDVTIPKCLMITGGIITDLPAERRQTISELAHGFLRKPFSRDELGHAIETMLRS